MVSVTSPWRTLKRVAAATLAGGLAALAAAPAAHAYPDGPWFVADKPYVSTSQWVPGHNITIGDLADPNVFLENGTYYAYGTNGGGRNVPLIVSKDLKNWKTNQRYTVPKTSPDGRPVLNAGDSWYNDTLALPGSWALRQNGCNTAQSGCYEIWAPSVEKAANGKYIMAYAARTQSTLAGVDRWCIGLAQADKPTGPFFDTSRTPFVCSDDPAGAIDPDLYKDNNGKLYLYWKNEGNAAQATKTKIWVRELNNTGTAWAPNTSPQSLLETSVMKKAGSRDTQTWEETLIENPSMVSWQGKYYLFYSASQYSTLDYRTGYAECSSATGPCKRVSHTPLLQTDARWSLGGPGGSNAFLDSSGQLRLATAAWRPERAGYDTRWNSGLNACRTIERFFETSTACTSNQRFLHIGTVQKFGPAGLLALPKKSEFAWTASQKYPAPISFIDYSPRDAFYNETNWLAHTGVTRGWDTPRGPEYRPANQITRGEMAAFMYRLAGSPAYTPPARSPFWDVQPSHVFYKEIMWLYSVRVTTGFLEDGSFRPADSVTREQMAAFMYRLAGSPTNTANGSFTDMSQTRFPGEVAWLKQQGISTGYSDGTYRPLNQVRRDEMAAFMYRLTQRGPLMAKPWPGA
ncbi:family 43 glycosylhydrolase [Rothia nasimurium]|uniref:family 43 glycosylhydrolase n=1 Tax=Rothia nasimurium TaxID=85336 RepID=UPI002DD69A34|nr:family 43 glycosylhydrolase [Rothia nasimurium]